jgi:hypothetical protein
MLYELAMYKASYIPMKTEEFIESLYSILSTVQYSIVYSILCSILSTS